MALKGGFGDSVTFWDSVASKFGTNDHVFYELYNEPHIGTAATGTDLDTFLNGNTAYTGMIDMIAAVRAHSKDSVLVIAGQLNWAYDATSLITLDGMLDASN